MEVDGEALAAWWRVENVERRAWLRSATFRASAAVLSGASSSQHLPARRRRRRLRRTWTVQGRGLGLGGESVHRTREREGETGPGRAGLFPRHLAVTTGVTRVSASSSRAERLGVFWEVGEVVRSGSEAKGGRRGRFIARDGFTVGLVHPAW
jgi:hypothetical protein